MNSFRQKLKDNKIVYACLGPIHHLYLKFLTDVKHIKLYFKYGAILSQKRGEEKIVFHIGIPVHANLGDLAQGICIQEWIKKHYSEYMVIGIETECLVATKLSLLNKLKKAYKEGDLIVFQSGYTTTDLGGYADEMHRAVIRILPDAKILMMPQTIYFKSKQNQTRTAREYSLAKNMLFLSRDRVSYEMAEKMFSGISQRMFPDIVTTLIGTREYSHDREGILLCCRDDGEKYYSSEEINELKDKCSELCKVEITDTTKNMSKKVVRQAKEFIDKEIDKYAHYKIMITDRYHGTIFSLIAGTPVIIIKTKDHKVVTGAEWFKGVYDDYVYLANDLNDAYKIAKKLYFKLLKHKLAPYFEPQYYDKLPALFEKSTGE